MASPLEFIFSELLRRSDSWTVQLPDGAIAIVEEKGPGYQFTLVAPKELIRLFEEPPSKDSDWAHIPRWCSMSHHLKGSGTVLVAGAHIRRIDEYPEHPRTYTDVTDEDMEAVVMLALKSAKECLLSREISRFDKMRAAGFVTVYNKAVADVDALLGPAAPLEKTATGDGA